MRWRMRNSVRSMIPGFWALGGLAVWVFSPSAALAAEDQAAMADRVYYKVPPMFHPYPDASKPVQAIDRFGPVGIGIELLQPAFKMRVKNVEEGSPAAATGKLKPGQLIDSINERVLKDMDPRRILGDIIARAEASDGLVKLMIRENKEAKPETVVVKIPVLGAYSSTWPLNCPKSDTIVRNMADYLTKTGANGMGLGTLFLLSTGAEQDLEVVRARMQEIAAENRDKTALGSYPWYIGYGGPALCEYYLRTGDKSILHTIQLYADHLDRTMYNGAWGGKGIGSYFYMAGGHMNAAGVHCLTFLMLAKECGVMVNDDLLETVLKHFYRYTAHGAVSYGDGMPEATYVDNGRNGGLAFAMAAAASLTPGGEPSVYAKARDAAAMTSFYSTSWMLHGHTGGGIGEIWRGGAMGLLHDRKPAKYREFMNNRAWFYDLSRRYDGSSGIVGGERYDEPGSWGIGMALVYTIPRKTLRMTGASKTPYAKACTLPERPWGTAADDVFFSLAAAAVRGGPPRDVDAETLMEDGSGAVLRKLKAEDATDATLLRYAHHPDIEIRHYAAGTIKRKGRDDLTLELLRSKDPRVRDTGIASIGNLTDEMAERLLAMIEDPEESWWVTLNAMSNLGAAPPELIAPHVERLVHWLQHDEWWLSKAAMTALTPVATDKRFCREILPIIGKMIVDNTHAVALSPLYGIVEKLKEADPGTQAFAIEVFSKAYEDFPKTIRNRSGSELDTATPYLLGGIARNLAALPGGFDALYTVGKERFPEQSLPHQDLFMDADASTFGPIVRKALEPVVLEALIPQYIGNNRDLLLKEKRHEKIEWGYYYREPRMESLVALYNRIGVHDYDWHDIGPVWNGMEWDYFTFDPPEEKAWQPGTRYRPVTCPRGMENWFAKDFDAKQAGWKRGLQPFGQEDGKLRTEQKPYIDQELRRPPDRRGGPCTLSFCRCCDPMNTLWEKEVLLMRGTFTFPAFKEGSRYRLVVGGQSDINNGDGYRIYVNGKMLVEQTTGVGKGGGGRLSGYWIDKAWWPEFQSDAVTIAATSFLKVHRVSNVKRGFIAVWLQEMKVPPLGAQEILKSAAVVPMRSGEWQALQDPDNAELDPEQGKFRWDGTFAANPAVPGRWTQLGQVATIEAFEPGKQIRSNKDGPLQQITFKDQGRTDDPLWIWSGDTLMDLNKNEALKLTAKTIDGADYLFIEAGGFNARNGPKWKPPLFVMKCEGK